MIQSSENASHRKRDREIDELHDILNDGHPARADQIQSFSLEAIFHPKFDNENRQTQSIRNQMKWKVDTGEGYLEVSLKHSGYLLLWSGGQHYYSKNSTGTAFTSVGELLLRQHFFRAWYSMNTSENHYQECSEFLEKNRLTLAFEVVTAVLGQHGDLPKKDFLILTAVADKSVPRFYGTVEVLEFAQRYRLPHNDLWMHATLSSVESLFSLYDTIRETGLAGNTIRALTSISDAHASSIYPHVNFQGEILEGVVIRYVSFEGTESGKYMEKLHNLDITSTEILKAIPHDTPMAFEIMRKGMDVCLSKNHLMCTSIRDVYDNCVSKDGYDNLTTRVGDVIDDILKKTDSSRRITFRNPERELNVPKLATSVLRKKSNIDDETRCIASVIVKLDEMNAIVRYPVFQEQNGRIFCTIHVLHDKTFLSYQKKMAAHDMDLYRGFFIELNSNQHVKTPTPTVNQYDNTKTQVNNHVGINTNDLSLMLKMKFLPYMIRTFCCRNGLNFLTQNGVAAFTKYTMKMMNSWGISVEVHAKWQPFFRSWGQYVCEYLNGADRPYIDRTLPPLTAEFYLNHLEHFTPLFENGIIKCENSVDSFNNSTYKAMVVVVAIEKNIALLIAKHISEKLGGVYIHEKLNTITEEHLINMRAEKSGGLIAYTSIEGGPKVLKKFIKVHGKSMSIILFDCDDHSIESLLSSDVQRMKGVAKSWRKLRVDVVKDVASSSFPETQEDMHIKNTITTKGMKEVLMELQNLSDKIPALDNRQGLLVFFPSIPGSGKSTLSSSPTRSTLNNMLKKLNDSDPVQKLMQRKLIVLVSDEHKKRYWPEVKRIRAEYPESLFIADKNAPPNAWWTLAESAGNGIVVPVIPDGKALSTTRILGMYTPTGDSCNETSHYYPFSLHYLAICLTRVLTRPSKTHIGGLDNSVLNSAMIVINFFGLYQHITADDFLDKIRLRIEQAGGDCASTAIQVRFFVSGDLPDLPVDFSETLIDALRLRYGYNKNKKDPTRLSLDPAVKAMEQRLREVVEKHKIFICSLQVDESTSRKDFVDQITHFAKTINNENSIITGNSKNNLKFIRLVSIDISQAALHDAIKEMVYQESEVGKAFEYLGIDVKTLWVDNKSNNGIIQKPHVTMAYHKEFSQVEIRSKFSGALGNTVDISVSGFLWNESIAAFTVEVPTTSMEGNKIPVCGNKFAHITFWKKGVKAFESNSLPFLVEQGRASSIDIHHPISLKGKFNFWHV